VMGSSSMVPVAMIRTATRRIAKRAWTTSACRAHAEFVSRFGWDGPAILPRLLAR
jgi:hypothetical protein